MLQMMLVLGLCLVMMLVAPLTESAPAPAPAPVTVEALLAAQLLTIAGLKGYLIGNALAGKK